ncbi:MAG: glycogen/starch/alpha-glucan phosphorylase [Alphaproteobacteria bacterium]|nr:glycogen/starch/alpha-glucan phosphorylase [Alphaproteobacteria bacterium]
MENLPIKDELWINDKRNWDNPEFVKQQLLDILVDKVGKHPGYATPLDWYLAISCMLNGLLNRREVVTHKNRVEKKFKRVYYLSLEYLLGRQLDKVMVDLDLKGIIQDVMKGLGQNIDEIEACEQDPALGNGGLGRLAACFMDSMATQGYPGYGYGIRYEYGMFNQEIRDGKQVEHPENWLRYGNPWETSRPDVRYRVHFFGRVILKRDENGREVREWVDTERVTAQAYDMPVSGYDSETVATMRLWSARATRDFDLYNFNEGNYIEAVREKTLTETLSRVLYPMDSTLMGQELRLKQEYFFVSASLQDILHRYLRRGASLDDLPKDMAIQLNDTHPALSVPELMRLLIDEHNIGWDKAWSLTRQVFSYTNHTLLAEALETWPIEQIERILPRHIEIIYRINHDFLKEVRDAFADDLTALSRMSIIDNNNRCVRMAHLAIVGSHKVNGVAALHTKLLRENVFSDFDQMTPDKFVNMTNGVTPRRWLLTANPNLSELISEKVGKGWIKNLDLLKGLTSFADDKEFCSRFAEIKKSNKLALVDFIKESTGVTVNPDAMMCSQIKRIHEYKRQLLNLLHVIYRYNMIKDGKINGDCVPRTVLFGGKAAPGYYMAKQIIHLINNVANTINNDAAVGDLLKVVYIPNYNVTSAEIIIPGTELSEQISTAGTEASGTGNMKFALNGALTIGTLDGANVEIAEQVGDENIFIFGLKVEEVEKLKKDGYNPYDFYNKIPELKRIIDMIDGGFFSPEEPKRFSSIIDSILRGKDKYMIMADFECYIKMQEKVDRQYKDSDTWTRKAVLNTANVGCFSSDRTIHEYAKIIWDIKTLT